MKSSVIVGVFVVLTIVFASISAFEFVQLGNGRTVTATITMYPSTSQTSLSSSSPAPYPDNGYIQIGNLGYFAYTRIPISSGVPITSAQTFRNVNFTYVKPNATITGGVCVVFKVNFQVDSASENLTACSYPTNFETVMVFSKHTKPMAGLTFEPSGDWVYLLVSA